MREQAERNRVIQDLFDDSIIKYTGEIEDLESCDRIVAIMVADGKVYLSDCDHQDCLEQYYQEIGKSSGIDWSDDSKYDDNLSKAVKITDSFFASENNDIHGFSVFEGYDDNYYLVAHFPINLSKCLDLAKQYAEENDCIIGTFYDSSYKIKVVDVEETEKVKLECLVKEGLQSGVIKVEIEDLDMNELKISIGDNWFWTYVDHIDNKTLLDSIDKEELISKIAQTMLVIKEELNKDEFLYYTYYLEESLLGKDNHSLDEKIKLYSNETTSLNDSNELIKNDYSYEVRG